MEEVDSIEKDSTEDLQAAELNELYSFLVEQDNAGVDNPSVLDEVDINMVMILPGPSSIPRSPEDLLAVDLKEIIPMNGPNRHRHLKSLYIIAQVEGMSLSKVFVDYGAMVNILPSLMMKKLSKIERDLILSGFTMSNFISDKTNTKGVLPLKITMANQTRIAAFYVVDSNVDYNMLLDQDPKKLYTFLDFPTTILLGRQRSVNSPSRQKAISCSLRTCQDIWR